MVQICDNSGAKFGCCVSVPLRAIAKEGDIILVSVRELTSGSKIQKGTLFKAVIVSVKKALPRKCGFITSFSANKVVLLNNQGSPLGKRILGPVSYTLRLKKRFRLLFLSSVVL